jgi:hypothetical protein
VLVGSFGKGLQVRPCVTMETLPLFCHTAIHLIYQGLLVCDRLLEVHVHRLEFSK